MITVKKSVCLLICVLLLLGVCSCSKKRGGTVDAEKSGLISDDAGAAQSNRDLLNKMISESDDNRTIHLSSGTYYVASQGDSALKISEKSGFTLLGDDATLIGVGETDFCLVDCTDSENVTLSGVKFTCTAKAKMTLAVQLRSCAYVTVKDCAFSSASARAVDAQGGNDINIVNCTFKSESDKPSDNGAAVRVTDLDGEFAVDGCAFNKLGGSALAVRAAHARVEVTDTAVTQCGSHAFDMVAQSVAVENCAFKNVALNAVKMTPSSSSVEIENCTFDEVCTADSDKNYGVITVRPKEDASDRDVTEQTNIGVKIKKNTFTSCGSTAIYVTAIRDLVIANNTVKDSGTSSPSTSIFEIVLYGCSEVAVYENSTDLSVGFFSRNTTFVDR